MRRGTDGRFRSDETNDDDESVLRAIKSDFAQGKHLEVREADYNILMIGTAGVGKTVFMTTMIAELMRSRRGLNLKPLSAAHGAKLGENYALLCSGGEIPATGRFESWRFEACYGQTKLFSFRWVDYRGGSVDPNSIIRGDELDALRVISVLRQPGTVAVFVLADAERFSQSPDDVREELAAIRRMLERCFTDLREKRGLYLTLVLTKADVVGLQTSFLRRRWNRAQLFLTCQEVFDDIFSPFVSGHEGVLCDVIPISAFGTSARSQFHGPTRARDSGAKLPSFQVDIPLRVAFKYILRDLRGVRIPELKKAIESERAGHNSILPSWHDLSSRRQRKTHLEAIRRCDEILNHLRNLADYSARVVEETERMSPIWYRLT